ncbi:hypothetical protein Tco_1291319, partial [Tanacetum coccineum]
ETSLFEYDEKEQNVLYFYDLFPFNIIYPDDLKSDKGNDDNEIDMIRSSGGNENRQGSIKLLEASHDKINKVFIMKSFVMKLNVNIVAWNYLVSGMLFNLIKNFYASFGIPFYPNWYYQDGDCARMLRRPRSSYGVCRIHPQNISLNFYKLCANLVDFIDMALPPRDQRHQYLRFKGLQYTDANIADFETRFGEAVLDLDRDGALQFQLGGVRRLRARDGSLIRGSECLLDRDLVCGGFSGYTPFYTLIRDSMLRLCHRLIACSIVGRSQAPEKVTVTDLFYLREMDVGSVNVPYLLARYLRLFASGRKQGAMICGDMAELVRLQICVELDDTWAWVPAVPSRQEGDAGGVAEEAPVVPEGGDEDEEMPLAGQREVLDIMARDFSRFTTWTVTSLAWLMDRASMPYTRYSESLVEYQRRTRQRTGKASTFTAPQQPNP